MGGLQYFSVSPSPWVLNLIGTWLGLCQVVFGIMVLGLGLDNRRGERKEMKFIILGLNLLFDELCKGLHFLNDEFSFMIQINIFPNFLYLGSLL